MGSDRRRRRLHHSPLDDDAGGGVPPQGDEELARRGDDGRLAHPPAKAPDPLVEPQLSAEVGWFCNHSQASSTIVVLSRGLPALDTPCSWSIEPLFHGVGAKPA